MTWFGAYLLLSAGVFLGYCLCAILSMNGRDDDDEEL